MLALGRSSRGANYLITGGPSGDGFAPSRPIRVHLARDEELGLPEPSQETVHEPISCVEKAIIVPPPAYGVWRCSVVSCLSTPRRFLRSFAYYVLKACKPQPITLAPCRPQHRILPQLDQRRSERDRQGLSGSAPAVLPFGRWHRVRSANRVTVDCGFAAGESA